MGLSHVARSDARVRRLPLPYTPGWLDQLLPVNPALALIGAQWQRLSGRSDPCCYCGDWPTRLYLAENPPAVLLYLCADCPDILKEMFGSRLCVVGEKGT